MTSGDYVAWGILFAGAVILISAAGGLLGAPANRTANYLAARAFTRRLVQHRLKEGFSPAQISRELKVPLVVVQHEAELLAISE